MSVLRRYSNVAVITSITTAINASVTTFTVYNSTGYPDAPFSVQIDNEVILVGTKVGNVFSDLTRGFDGTAAATHPIGTEVEHVAIADDFNHRWQELILDKPRGSWDEEFDTDTKDAAWVETTVTGTATWTQLNGVLSALYEDQTASDVAAIMKPLSIISPMYVETAVRLFGPAANYNTVGLILADGTSTTSNCSVAYLRIRPGR